MNDALRLRFVQKGRKVVQEAQSEIDPPVRYRDFVGDSDPARQASDWLDEMFWRPFRVTDCPLFEFIVARVAVDRVLWLERYHHLIIDATGRRLVARQVAAAYAAVAPADGNEPSRSDRPSYRLAERAEAEYLASPQFASDEMYWRERLSGLSRSWIAADKRMSERLRSGRPRRLNFDLDLDASNRLRALAREQNSSVFKLMSCLVWSCFSSRYGCEDLIIGVTVANRRSPVAKECVGLFAKMLPFRLRLTRDMSLSEALKVLDATLTADMKHQQFPFSRIVGGLDLRRMRRSELFDVAVNYVRGDYGFDIGGAPITCRNISSGFPFPLLMTAFDGGESEPIRVVLDSDSGRVPADDLLALFDCLRRCFFSTLRGDHALGALTQELVGIEQPRS